MRQLRAALVALHLFAITAMAVPETGNTLRKGAWNDPTVQSEFRQWTRRLNGVGVAITKDQLQDQLWNLSRRYQAARKTALAPFAPYYRVAGTRQAWRMFVAPHRHPAKMLVQIKTDGEWATVYRSRSESHVWMKRELDNIRLRSAVFRYSWPQYKRSRSQFADWLRRKALVDYPDAQAISISFEKRASPTPEELLSGDVPLTTERFRTEIGL